MAYVGDHFYSKDDWGDLALPRQDMAAHLLGYTPGWKDTVEYTGDDARLPESVRLFNHSIALQSVAIVPLILPTRNLGWIALSTGDAPAAYGPWRRAALTKRPRLDATIKGR